MLYTVPKGDCMVAPFACMYEREKVETERERARETESE